MKILLRSAIFTYCLLFLPDPLLAADGPPLPVMKSDAIDETQPKADVLRKIIPKSEYFASKRPLPAVSLPPDWDGLKKSPARQKRKAGAKPKKRTPQNVKSPMEKNKDLKASQPLPERKITTKETEETVDKTTLVKSGRFNKTGIATDSPSDQGLLNDLDMKNGGDRPGIIATIPLPIRRADAGNAGLVGGKSAAKVLQKDLPVTPVVLPVPPPLTKWKDAEIASAQQQCKVLLKDVDVTLKPVAPIRKGECGTPAPVRVTAIGKHKGKGVKISPAATLNCNYTAMFAKWVKNKLQPLAKKHFNSRVKMIHNMSSYSCRRRYNGTTTKISEHALANALDIGGLTLANGTVVSVLKHWEDSDEKSEFLKEMHQSACQAFVVVLGPEANEAHKNHFHFDVGRYKVCE